MIDFRYHALSLAAVIIALALGVLLGVAIGDSNLVSSAKNGVVHGLDGELAASRRQAASLERQLSAERRFAGSLYPLAVHGLLAGRTVGLAFLGTSSDQVDQAVADAVAEGGGSLATVVAVREPPDRAALTRGVAGTRYAVLTQSRSLLGHVGEIVGSELVGGAPRAGPGLLARARPALLSAFDGQLTQLQSLVVMRSDPRGMTAADRRASTFFEDGLIRGAQAAGVTVVGVEQSRSAPSQIAWYRSRGISSVDDLDVLAGRAALLYALAGSRGTFGEKATAEALLPAPPTP